MADPLLRDRLVWRAVFVAIALALFVLRILPLGAQPVSVPGPDLLLCLTFVWVLRRPDYVPAVLIAVVFLLEDMLMQRPPGLWAAIVLLGSEFLRGRESLARELPFGVEWAMVSAVLLMMMLADRLVLAIVMTPQPFFAPAFLQVLLTILAYPGVVLLSKLMLGVRKAATGEVDRLGRRL